MKKTFSVNGGKIEMRECTFTYDGETVSGLYIHDLDDVNGDGDGVIGNCVSMPETDEDAADMIANEHLDTDCDTLATVEFC